MTSKDLRQVIGRQLNYKGHNCEIIEVLEDGPQLVLRNLDVEVEPSEHSLPESKNPIQANQFGEAHRRTPETFTIPAVDKNSRPIAFLEVLIQQG